MPKNAALAPKPSSCSRRCEVFQKLLRLALLLLFCTAPTFSPEALHFWQRKLAALNSWLPF